MNTTVIKQLFLRSFFVTIGLVALQFAGNGSPAALAATQTYSSSIHEYSSVTSIAWPIHTFIGLDSSSVRLMRLANSNSKYIHPLCSASFSVSPYTQTIYGGTQAVLYISWSCQLPFSNVQIATDWGDSSSINYYNCWFNCESGLIMRTHWYNSNGVYSGEVYIDEGGSGFSYFYVIQRGICSNCKIISSR